MLEAAQRHLSMFATAVMLVSLVGFLLSTGSALGTERALPPGLEVGAAGIVEGSTPRLDIGDPMSIEKEIIATQVDDALVNYDVAVYNYSPVDALRLDSLDDADLGNLDGRGSCSMPQVVLAGAAYRCSFLHWVGAG